jgi:hypothetical protein
MSLRTNVAARIVGLGFLASSALVAASVDAGGRRPMRCPVDLHLRTPEETIEEHIALIQAGEMERAMCNFAQDAVVMLPGQIVRGKTEIQAGLEAFAGLFGDAVPVVETLTTEGPVVLLTFHVFGPELSIPNGSDTYFVRHGKIQYQTVHDVIEPTEQ